MNQEMGDDKTTTFHEKNYTSNLLFYMDHTFETRPS